MARTDPQCDERAMTRKRIMLFCHDGTGLGHLRRTSRIAAALQERFSCLVVTGAREALWLVPAGCELIKLPSWDGIDDAHAARRGRAPAIDMSRREAVAFLEGLIDAAARSFQPDAILVDYLPLGKCGELHHLILTTSARKYLVHRGISDTSDASQLRGAATELIAGWYDRILVMADPRVSDLVHRDRYCRRAEEKMAYCGYILPEITRPCSGPSFDVVCAGGGGRNSEDLLRTCVSAARDSPDLTFAIVLGPRSSLSRTLIGECPVNATVFDTEPELPQLLASAPIVVCTGGYNSVLEAVTGGARVIVHPSQRGMDDEQKVFAAGLAQYYPVRLVEDLAALGSVISEETKMARQSGRAAFPLAKDGLANLVERVSRDLA